MPINKTTESISHHPNFSSADRKIDRDVRAAQEPVNTSTVFTAYYDGPGLRPPELQLERSFAVSEPRYLEQAIANIEILKSNSPESVIDALQLIIGRWNVELESSGLPSAVQGFEEIKKFSTQFSYSEIMLRHQVAR
ncbi:hypothetical protein FEE96_22955 [Parasedimentitalea maritima]|uniref:Transcriptional regulator n=1 Tax=Parasedimentitalea maritima TaxID=2578117 RepID=A0ABY2USF2_9RHOB|nr:hypothetical protein [Zongyanglinia marina]TLP55336.1 hypothetical protein FEE96_22955 [Zongyanglinia marina]